MTTLGSACASPTRAVAESNLQGGINMLASFFFAEMRSHLKIGSVLKRRCLIGSSTSTPIATVSVYKCGGECARERSCDS